MNQGLSEQSGREYGKCVTIKQGLVFILNLNVLTVFVSANNSRFYKEETYLNPPQYQYFRVLEEKCFCVMTPLVSLPSPFFLFHMVPQ